MSKRKNKRAAARALRKAMKAAAPFVARRAKHRAQLRGRMRVVLMSGQAPGPLLSGDGQRHFGDLGLPHFGRVDETKRNKPPRSRVVHRFSLPDWRISSHCIVCGVRSRDAASVAVCVRKPGSCVSLRALRRSLKKRGAR